MKTIYDVAKEVGCAPSTVSKYITKNGYVSRQMGLKIQAAMVKLDYHYNGVARILSTKQNNRIGIIVPFLDHPYFQRLVNAISMAAAQAGKEVVILPTNYQQGREINYLQELAHNLFDSLIITSHSLSNKEIAKYGKFGRIVFCEQTDINNASYVTNNRQQTYQRMFKKLTKWNLHKIGFLFVRPPQESKTTRETLAAYQAVFHQPASHSLLTYNCHSFTDGQEKCQILLKNNPNIQAIFTESDITAAGAYQVLKERKKTSVMVIGQGNTPFSQLLAFSSIDQHLKEMGADAVKLALNKEAVSIQKIKFDIHWR